MKAKLQARLKSKKGFTLVELLVVVAILAILVAISVPMVSYSLNNAKQATDAANVRAAEGAAMVTYLTSEETGKVYYVYDAESGTVEKKDTEPSTVSGVKGYNQSSDSYSTVEGAAVVVTIDSTSGITSEWVQVSNGG